MAIALSAAFDAAWGWFCANPGALWALPAAGVAELVLYRALGLPAGFGGEDVARAARAGELVPLALAPAIFAATCLSVACGASVGKEAAAVQLCAAAAAGIALAARRVSGRACGAVAPGGARDSGDASASGGAAFAGAACADGGLVMQCGMAAGIGALFHAPVTGALMAFEATGWSVLRGGRSSAARAGCVLLASACAAAVAVVIEGRALLPGTISSLVFAQGVPVAGWALLFGVVLVCAASGALYRVALRGVHAALARMNCLVGGRDVMPFAIVAVGGLALACAADGLGLQACGGSGFDLLPAAFAGAATPALVAAKMLLTMGALACGLKGGEIMPALVIGALLGSALASAAGAPASFAPQAAAAGMLAFLAAARSCPLSACALGVELLVLPALL